MKCAGYCGRVIRVDLGSGGIAFEKPGPGFYRSYLGGPGVGLYYLLKTGSSGMDPLGPGNVLVFASGLLTGTSPACVSRVTICARSPLSGGLGKTEAAGYWGAELKRAGYDALVVTGRAPGPVYLWITGGGVEIRSASRIWSLDTGEAEEFIRHDTGAQRPRLLVIGPGGENMVRFAVIGDATSPCQGRNGLGAVMGSKNLKAVAVYTSGAAPFSGGGRVARCPAEHGGPRPWQEEQPVIPRGVGDLRVNDADNTPGTVAGDYRWPAWDSLAVLGPDCGIANRQLLNKVSEMCHRYTLDITSTGKAISFAMACYELGLIGGEDTGGMDLRFGNEEVILCLIEQIAYRQGFGRILADGLRGAAARIGRGAAGLLAEIEARGGPRYDPEVGDGSALPSPFYPPDYRLVRRDRLTAAGGSQGVSGAAYPGSGRVRLILYNSFLNAMYDSLGVCMAGSGAGSGITVPRLVDLVRAVTGWETSRWELIKAGERINTMARLFDCGQGCSAPGEVMPGFFTQPWAVDFRQAVSLYYGLAGWEPGTGIPTAAKLHELGLDEFLEQGA